MPNTQLIRRAWQMGRTLLQLTLRRPLVATSVIPLLSDGRMVLIRRADNGLWGLPGGLMDWGEDVETAAKRELEEETGLQLVLVKRLVGVYSAANRDERFHSVCVALEATVDGEMTINDPDEVLEVKAFETAAIPTDQLAHDHYQQLQDYLAGTTGLT
ncbi:MAG: NUDIX hydrolase [Cyanobacteria bacterium J06581_3]